MTFETGRGWTADVAASIIESAPDGVVVIDASGIIRFVNAQTEVLFGYDRSEILGEPVEVLLPERFHAVHGTHRNRYTREPKVRPMGADLDLFGRRRDGTEFPIDISLAPIATEEPLFFASVRDVSDRRRAEELFRSFLESAPDAIVVVDAEGVIQVVNAQTEVLFGYGRHEMLGQRVEMLLPERFHEAHVGHRSGYVGDPRARPMGRGLRLFGRRRDGSEFPVDISLSPIETTQGRRYSAAIRDVTERERLSAIRDDFVRNAAHELRTPLSALAGFAELLASDRSSMTDAQVEESLQAMRRQGERANVLVANLLDLSRLEGGRADIKLTSVSVAEAAAVVLEAAPPPEGRTVQVEVDPAIRVLSERSRLEQLLTNLVVNAYRYGGPHITIAASASDGRVVLAVADDGEGIPDELRGTLFDPFTRGRKAGSVGGSGIGLALCRLLAQAFDGEIWFEPVDPNGASFKVRLRETT